MEQWSIFSWCNCCPMEMSKQPWKKRSGISSKPSYTPCIDHLQRVVVVASLLKWSCSFTPSTPGVERRQLTQFMNIFWPQKLVSILDPSFVFFPLSWLWPFFPRADFYSQILEFFVVCLFFNSNGCFTFAVNPLPSPGCHASILDDMLMF